MKKHILFSLFSLFCITKTSIVFAATSDTLHVHRSSVPIMLTDDVNPIVDMWFSNVDRSGVLSEVCVEFSKDTPIEFIESVDIYFTGTTSMFRSRSKSQAMSIHSGRYSGGQTIFKHPSYAIPVGSVSRVGRINKISISEKGTNLKLGSSYFYVSVRLKKNTPLTALFSPIVSSAQIGGKAVTIKNLGEDRPLRVGVSVRNAGDNGVDSYRIPGLATAKDGTLLGVYDIRHTSSTDLQEDIEVGLSRSTDGGRTWLPMQTIISMRGYGSLPNSQNGVGDPAILVDEKSGRVWAIGLWAHGASANTAWFNLKQGIAPEDEAAQIVVTYSDDNGKRWSEPINITSQVKDLKWFITLQGPGRGITMKDGTLVFAFQYVDTDRLPYSTIIYSKDGGKSWKAGNGIISNTTEAQVVELSDGVLMINARDNRGGSRRVMTTTDMGQSWIEHPSSRSALREPVCMASLLKTTYQGKEILLFSNPDTLKSRSRMTIKVSTDNGLTWSKGILLDEEPGWGYSCLTHVDDESVGILYEGSRSEMTFQKIRLADFFN